MWAHYADSHRGFVIGLDEEHTFLNKSTHYITQPYQVRKTLGHEGFASPRPVRYEHQRLNIHSETTMPWDALFWKSKAWKYEQELRVFRSLDDADSEKNGIALFKIPPEALRRVILGAAMQESTVKKFVKVLGEPRYAHVQVERAHLARRTFDIETKDYWLDTD